MASIQELILGTQAQAQPDLDILQAGQVTPPSTLDTLSQLVGAQASEQQRAADVTPVGISQALAGLTNFLRGGALQLPGVAKQPEGAKNLFKSIFAIGELEAKNVAAKAKSTADRRKKSIKEVTDLRKERNGNDITRNSVKVSSAFEKVKSSAKSALETGNPASGFALIFNFFKTIDPGSTVREGEFANLSRAGSLGDRFRGFVSQLDKGIPISRRQINGMLIEAEGGIATQIEAQKGLDETLRKFGSDFDIDTTRAITPIFSKDTLSSVASLKDFDPEKGLTLSDKELKALTPSQRRLVNQLARARKDEEESE